VAESLVKENNLSGNYAAFKLDAIRYLGIDTKIDETSLSQKDEQSLIQSLYEEAIQHYEQRKKAVVEQTLPVISNIRKEQGNHIQNVVVPFTDGRRALQTLVNLDHYQASSGSTLMESLERTITLMLIDEAWKEHLRSMDDLRHSVQTAGYEQKDPLVIYKIEAFNAFKSMNDQVNKDIVGFLSHAQIPIASNAPEQIKEGRERKTDLSNMQVNKQEIDAAGQDYAANEKDYYDPSTPVKQEPLRAEPKIGRNDSCPCGSGKKFKQCHGKDA
jgi:preprotein translocase subunit SecA